MVKLVFNDINQIIKYKSIIDLLEGMFKRYMENKGVTYLMKTQKMHKHYAHSYEYFIGEDYIIKIQDDKLYLISDHICSVIDLTIERPYEIIANVR